MRCGLIRRSWVWFGAVRFGRYGGVGHGMVGLFRQARCEKVRLVPVKCGIVRSGRLGSMRCGWARFGMVRQAR